MVVTTRNERRRGIECTWTESANARNDLRKKYADNECVGCTWHSRNFRRKHLGETANRSAPRCFPMTRRGRHSMRSYTSRHIKARYNQTKYTLVYREVPKFSPYGSMCCACAQRPASGLPRACHSGFCRSPASHCKQCSAPTALRLRSTRAASRSFSRMLGGTKT